MAMPKPKPIPKPKIHPVTRQGATGMFNAAKEALASAKASHDPAGAHKAHAAIKEARQLRRSLPKVQGPPAHHKGGGGTFGGNSKPRKHGGG